MNFKSFAMNSVIGALKMRNAEAAAQAEAQAELEKEQRAFERNLMLKEFEMSAEQTAAERQREREESARAAQEKAMAEQARRINEANGFRFDEDGNISFVPKGRKLYMPKVDLKGFDEFELGETGAAKNAAPMSRLTPFSGIITEPKEQEPVEFSLKMPIGEYRTKLANREFEQAPRYGWDADVVGPVFRTSGTNSEAYNMQQLREFTFREGALEKFLTAKKNGNEENYNRLITTWQQTWDSYKETNEARQTTADGVVRIDTILSFIPEENREMLLNNTDFVDRVIMPTIDSSYRITRDQVFAELGLPAGGPADITAEGAIEVDVKEYPHLSWAVDQNANAYSGDFQNKVAEIASSAGLTNSETFDLLNSLGTQKSQQFLTQFTEARKWFAKNEPFVVENNQVVLDGSRLSPPGVDVGKLLAMFPKPEDRMKAAKAILGTDVMDGIPGVTANGKVTGMQALGQSVLGKDIRDISKMEASATAIITDTSSLITLINSGMVEGGVAGLIKTKGSALVDQAQKIINRIDISTLPRDGVDPQLLDNYREFEALQREVMSDIAAGEIRAEKLYDALTASLVYGVASMLQGGDFRNISDYDIRMASTRLGNLTALISNPLSAVPVLEQLQEQAEFQLQISQAFTRGNIYDVAAATMLNQYRGRNPQNPVEFIDVNYGKSAGLPGSGPLLDNQGSSSSGIPVADPNE